LDAMRPDAVVTVHATPAAAMAALAASGRALPPHTTAVTDFVAHSQGMPRPVDRDCVAAEDVRNEFVARGIPPDRVVVTGVPVRAEFSRPVETIAARLAWGLAPGLPTVVAMAGTQGARGSRGSVRCRRWWWRGATSACGPGSPTWPRAARCGWWATWRTCARCWP